MARMMADCRRFPSETNCSLVIIGDEEEVARAAAGHAVAVHGHEDTPDFREEVRGIAGARRELHVRGASAGGDADLKTGRASGRALSTQSLWRCRSLRPMTIRWISLVPSPISSSGASR